MTRSEVAKCLGKSVTAVRRLEGAILHPSRDARGVHHFDDEQVEALAARIRLGDVSIWRELRAASTIESGCHRCADLEAEVDALRVQLESQQHEHARAVQALHQEHQHERALVVTERRQLDQELKELIAAIEAD